MIAVYFHTISILPDTTISFDKTFSRVASFLKNYFFFSLK